MLSPAPTVDTPRLRLRAHRVDDLDDCATMWGDPEVTRYIGGRPFTREECWSRLLRNVGHWALMGYGYWVVCERDSGRFVGEVGCAYLRREMEPPLGDDPEAGWVLAPWAHGRGYATEAVAAALAWIAPRFARTVCIIDPGHTTSLRVAEKAGFARIAVGAYRGEPTVVLERTR